MVWDQLRPGSFAARLVAEAPTLYVLQADMLEELRLVAVQRRRRLQPNDLKRR
ncbi:MAG: hypothetical protein ACJ8AW_27275 [Rhodopila sp.]